jgi:DNA-binding transcriptional regulator LsrR (DeoR family)
MSSKFAEQMTLTEVAAELGISRQRVKQIETAALEKLRNNERVRVLYEGIIDGCDGARTHSNHLDYHGVWDSRAR